MNTVIADAPVPYLVRLQAFTGPLDLLLHLAMESKVDIHDIPIAEITAQYLEYIGEAQALDLEVAAEFLLMAATLMLIKAKSLVPMAARGNGCGQEGELDDVSQLRLRDELAARLVEYSKVKELASRLATLEESAARYIARAPGFPPAKPVDKPLPKNLTAVDLHRIYAKVYLSHLEVSQPFSRIPRDDLDVDGAMRVVLDTVKAQGVCRFSRLIAQAETGFEVLAVFLGILELVRLGRLAAAQTDLFGDIELGLGPNPDGISELAME